MFMTKQPAEPVFFAGLAPMLALQLPGDEVPFTSFILTLSPSPGQEEPQPKGSRSL